jgi:hypothetical protein
MDFRKLHHCPTIATIAQARLLPPPVAGSTGRGHDHQKAITMDPDRDKEDAGPAVAGEASSPKREIIDAKGKPIGQVVREFLAKHPGRRVVAINVRDMTEAERSRAATERDEPPAPEAEKDPLAGIDLKALMKEFGIDEQTSAGLVGAALGPEAREGFLKSRAQRRNSQKRLTREQINALVERGYARKEPLPLHPLVPLEEISEALGGKKKDGVKEFLAKVKELLDAKQK